MSKCELEIVVDRRDRTWRVGETVSGHVNVKVNADCVCEGLSLTFGWATHGRGSINRGPIEGGVLWSGTWRTGERHSHPFSFTVPRGPVSYHGESIAIDWYLTANAKVGWEVDLSHPIAGLLGPSAQLDVLVVPDGAPEAYDRGPAFDVMQSLSADNNPKIRWVMSVIAVLMATMFGGFLAAFLTNLDGWWWLLGPGIVSLPLLYGLFWIWRNAFAELSVGPVTLEVPPGPLRPGAEVPVYIAFTPRVPVWIRSVKAKFQATENAQTGSGSNRRSFTATLRDELVVLSGATSLRGGEAFSAGYSFRLPADAPASFSAHDNQVGWSVTVEVDLAWLPDWNTTRTIIVLPGASRIQAS